MQTLLQDLRYGVRMLIKRPGFTLVAIIALALGIGANTAIFSVVNAILLRPLGYTDSREVNKSFENMGATSFWPVNLTGAGDPERFLGMTVTHTFFPTLGVGAARGRVFTAEEDQPGREHVVVISDGLWRRRFGADPGLVGRTLTLNGESYTVVGVMPPGFQFGREFGLLVDFYAPIAFTPQQLDTQRWRNEFLTVVARLKPGVTLRQAQAEMDTVAANVRQKYFQGGDANDPGSWGLLLREMRELVVGDIKPMLIVLLV